MLTYQHGLCMKKRRVLNAPMDSRFQTKIEVKNQTVVRQQILEDEDYI